MIDKSFAEFCFYLKQCKIFCLIDYEYQVKVHLYVYPYILSKYV